ncbi:MAG: acyl-CoA-binding protein [Pseudomonadales bacterium]|nr:acyl-CoA-binding protein [Pseudomonadales bacterium]
MGKLKEMVVEDTHFTNRLRHSARRIQMAGLGLFAKLDEERTRLYKQIIEASDQKEDGGVVAKLNVLGNGTINLVLEESQRVFDDLVEAGEQFSANSGKVVSLKTADKTADKTLDQPVKKSAPAQAKNIKETTQVKPVQRAQKSVKVEVDEVLQSAFEQARKQAESSSDLSDEKALALMALEMQVEQGDVKGRRPAKAKVDECKIFDARREIKGMKQEEAMARYVEVVKKNSA